MSDLISRADAIEAVRDRDYEMYRYGVAYSRGWNDAMDFIFGRREESAKLTLLKPTEIRYDNHTEGEETDG